MQPEKTLREALKRIGPLLIGICAVLLIPLTTGRALAHVVEEVRYSGTYPGSSIDGSDAVGVASPTFDGVSGAALEKIDVDQSTGSVYVAYSPPSSPGRLYKFNSSGASQAFTALSPNTIIAPRPVGSFGDLVVDNSGTGTQGRIYAFPYGETINAYLPSGAETSFPISPHPNPGGGGYCGAAVGPTGNFWLAYYFQGIYEYTPDGVPTGKFITPSPGEFCDFAMDSQGNFYVPVQNFFEEIKKYAPGGSPLNNYRTGSAVAIDLSNDDVYVASFTKSMVFHYDSDGNLLNTFGTPEGSYPGLSEPRGIAVNQNTHTVYVTNNRNPRTVDTFVPTGPITVPDATTGIAKPTPTTALLRGTVNADGVSSTDCHFDWGQRPNFGIAYTNTVPCQEGNVFTGTDDNAVSAEITGLTKGVTYDFRLSVTSGTGVVVKGDNQAFVPQGLPSVGNEFVSDVHKDGARINATVNPDSGSTGFHVVYGTDTSYGSVFPTPDKPLSTTTEAQNVNEELSGLMPATEYHYKVVATNAAGTTESSEDHVFVTFPHVPAIDDSCPNTLARQQTGAALLSDCRAYELVSSAHTGGYDVESNLVPGQTPFDGYPRAGLRVLYGVHNGAILGVAGNPTNRGIDPYVATRGDNGWSTSYVGIPANNPYAGSPFSSSLAAADSNLETFAFGGPEICSPCFSDGSIGMPMHLADGSLVQGMKGSIAQPGATADGLVKKHFSADGGHFVFSTTSRFEPGGNNSTGDVSIYDRDLTSDTTQVVSTDPLGNPLACLHGAGNCHAPGDPGGIAELDISEDGSRILVGQRVSTDSAGNDYHHLYMHLGGSPNSLDLTPGASIGALYDGMSGDGSRVFLTTTDHLLGADSDASADIYEAAVDGAGALTLRLITTRGGSASNDDGCSPPGTPNWNVASGEGKCNALAFAGGAGVASGDGTFYFLSPELLDDAAEADGEEDEPNIYVVKPGSDPEFVAMLDSSVPQPPAPEHTLAKSNFLTGLANPESLAVDQNSGDIYVAEAKAGGETGEVSRWTASGAPDNFSSLGSNKITGQQLGGKGEGQIAVDSSNSPFKGALYVTTNAGGVRVYSENGEKLGELTGFSEACGVAVDQSNGDVYVGSYSSAVRRFRPISAATPVTNASYQAVTGIESANSLCNIDVSAEGHVYTWPYNGGGIKQYESSSFTPGFPSPPGTTFANGLNAQSDPQNGDLYVDEGTGITRYDSAGGEIEKFGSGVLTQSRGIGVNGKTRHVYATNGSSVLDFGYEPIDNPAILHAVKQAGTHHYGDFQVTPSGSFAVFATSLPLKAGYENAGHSEVYRYETSTQALDCVSCAPTGARVFSDSTLGSNGLSLTDDGRVFFDSADQLVLRDANGRKDVYEWQTLGTGNCDASNPNLFPAAGRCVSLISAGSSPFDSSLLSASADATDVYFFTHDTLAREDENGPLTKIYDARTKGGFFEVPPPALCAASDECHGPGSQAVGPPTIRTVAGGAGNFKREKCKKGFHKKHGKCVRKKNQRRHRRKSK